MNLDAASTLINCFSQITKDKDVVKRAIIKLIMTKHVIDENIEIVAKDISKLTHIRSKTRDSEFILDDDDKLIKVENEDSKEILIAIDKALSTRIKDLNKMIGDSNE